MRPLLVLAGGVVAVVATACGGADDATSSTGTAASVVTAPTTPPAASRSTTSTTTPPAAAAATTTTAAPPALAPVVRSGAVTSVETPVGDPLSISIPDIGVQSELIPAGLLDDGTVAVPDDPSIAGWFTGGPRPGERGPAVIMGHVDSRAEGPGVFYRLADLPIGATVTVDTTTGPQHFIVRSVEQYPKAQFPTDLVYGAEPAATLRLITCGGSFDRSIRHYRDNIVVFLVRSDV